jgi:tetratricopeptide (TPR) repeat protein
MPPVMPCARCGFSGPEDDLECRRCGVVFARLKDSRAARPPASRAAVGSRAPSAAPPPAHSRSWLISVPLALAALALGYALAPPRLPRAEAPPTPSAGRRVEAPPPAEPPESTLPAPLARPPIAAPDPATIASGITLADRALADALAGKVRNGSRSVTAEDLSAAAALLARYPEDPAVRSLVQATYRVRATREREDHQHAQAAGLLRRAIGVDESQPGPRLELLNLWLEAKDWPAAESAARDVIRLVPKDPDAWAGLGFALLHLDRLEDAEEALKTSLALRDTPSTSELLAHVQRGRATQKGMTEQRLAHFHVRYDGETHEEVGRALLRVLEHHYATLVRTFGQDLEAPIPVVLFSSQSYYDATGAPAWSGGQYDHLDGQISVPIGGLESGLDEHLDEVLMHEVVHAFVAQIAKGTAPRDVNEGLAQYLQGRRSASQGEAVLRALADRRVGGVEGFYLAALSFVEYLIAERGQGGINDLLRQMGATGSPDEAFRRVYGRSYHDELKTWSDRIRLAYGS